MMEMAATTTHADVTVPGMPRMLANFALFQAGWFACVIGGAHDMPWPGLLLAAVTVVWHVAISRRRVVEARLILAAIVIGMIWDSMLVASGLLRYPHAASVLAPAWIGALWALFATTLNVTLRWLRGRWLLSAVLGAICGPLSFRGGAMLGAVEFSGGMQAMCALAIGWALLVPALVWFASRHDGVTETEPAHV